MLSPATLAGRPLFETLAPLLASLDAAVLPDAAHLSQLLQTHAPDALSGSGAPIRFVPPPPDNPGYERHIHQTGEVPTRPDDWHDFFNALAWCVWPHSKTRCNALHLSAMAEQGGSPGRGRVRDGITQWDECGLLVVSTRPALLEGLARHAWREVFWDARAELLASTRFLVFGHALWDALRAPFFGLCAKAVYRPVDEAWLAQPLAAQQAEADVWLADWLARQGMDLGPRSLKPLPVLGIPGVVAESADPAYYQDTRQFRPRRA